MATLTEALALGWQSYQAGNHDQAEEIYRQILRVNGSRIGFGASWGP